MEEGEAHLALLPSPLWLSLSIITDTPKLILNKPVNKLASFWRSTRKKAWFIKPLAGLSPLQIAQTIIDKKADYILSLKGNQGNLHKAVKQWERASS